MSQTITISAPGKLILCGEHAVVYNCPAIALPLADLRATVTLTAGEEAQGLHFSAPELARQWSLARLPDDPLSLLATETLAALGVQQPALHVTITSNIPIASGMGSGAAVATALVRALAAYAEQPFSDEQVSTLVYENERRLHGTPSGIDNTVIAFNQAIWFVRGQPIEPVSIGQPLTLLVADTGIRSPTRLPVGEVRRRWQAERTHYEALFRQIGELSQHARVALANGNQAELGSLLNQNHELLRTIGVSSPELNRLVAAAQTAGALGAKLSGAGWGGVMFALVGEHAAEVSSALHTAGATRVMPTIVSAS